MDDKLIASELNKIAKELQARVGAEKKVYSVQSGGTFIVAYLLKIEGYASLDEINKSTLGLISNLAAIAKEAGSTFKPRDPVYVRSNGEIVVEYPIMLKDANRIDEITAMIEKRGFKTFAQLEAFP